MKQKISAFLHSARGAVIFQFIRFGLVGVSNTAISYGCEMLCYYVLFSGVFRNDAVKVFVTSLLSFVVSVTNSYIWNSRFVFRSREKKTVSEHLWAYLKTVACYALTGLLLAPILKLRLTRLGMAYWLAGILSLIVSVPLNFVLNKFWAFSQKRKHPLKTAGKEK